MIGRHCAHKWHLRASRRTVAIGAGAVLLAGCQFGGLNSLNMPGTAGHGAGSYTITVELPDVATLPQNSPVMVDDVTVGSVSGIDAVQRPDGTFYAAVQLSLDENVNLPANATANVAQTSLLGFPARRAGRAGRPGSGRQARRGFEYRAGQHRPLSDHRGSAVVAGRRGQQGQSRCAAGHHRRGVQRGRWAGGQLRRPGTPARRVDQFTGPPDRDIIAAAEGLNRFAGDSGAAARTVWDAHWMPCRTRSRCSTTTAPTSSMRSERCRASRPSRPTSWPRPRTTSQPTSRTSTRSSSPSTTTPTF